MKRISGKIADHLLSQGLIKEDEIDLYKYAVYCFVLQFSSFLLSMIMSALMGQLLSGVLILMPFVCLRKYSGGFHSKSVLFCMFSSTFILVIGISLVKIVMKGFLWMFCMLFSGISIIILSPIDSESRVLNMEEKKHCKKVVVLMIIFFMAGSGILYYWGLKKMAVCLSMGLVLTCITQYLHIIKN